MAWLQVSSVDHDFFQSYTIDAEMRRQVAPFLQAGIQPDIVLLENEGSAGCLYEIKLPNGDTYSRYGVRTCDLVHTQCTGHACCCVAPMVSHQMLFVTTNLV